MPTLDGCEEKFRTMAYGKSIVRAASGDQEQLLPKDIKLLCLKDVTF